MAGDLDPRTLRLSADEWEQLDQEAEERGFENRTEYVRWIIRNRNGINENTVERLDELEEKIEDVREIHGEWLEDNEERIDRLWREVIA